jgi:hypothetical protein
MAGPNALSLDLMTVDERIAEIGQILALGLIRLHARKSSPISPDRGDSLVDLSPKRSGHADAPTRRTA